LRYGNTYYDYDEGTIVFFAPEQIISTEPEGEMHQPFGTALVFHPDLIKGTSWGDKFMSLIIFLISQTKHYTYLNEKRNYHELYRKYIF
jgi:hypothetical protein